MVYNLYCGSLTLSRLYEEKLKAACAHRPRFAVVDVLNSNAALC